jgi:hypothetical protein
MKKPQEPQLFAVRVTSAFVVEGAIARKGQVVELPEEVAKDVLRRGKAVVASDDEAPKAETASDGSASEQQGESAAGSDDSAKPRRSKSKG